MKKIILFTLGLALIAMPTEAKKKEDKPEKPAKHIKETKDLRSDHCYTIATDGLVWMVDSARQVLTNTKTIGAKESKKSVWQQFVLLSANYGTTHYLYNIGAKAFVGKDGKLTKRPIDALRLKSEDKSKQLTLSFADTLILQNANDLLHIGMAPQKNKLAATEITLNQKCNAAEAVSMVDDVAYSNSVQQGLFNISEMRNDWYWDIPDELIGRRILLTVRYTGTPAGTQQYGGELVKQQTVYWEPSPNDELLLRAEMSVVAADSSNAIQRAVKVSNVDPIIASFKVERQWKGKRRIKVTPLFSKDDPAIGFSSRQKTTFGLTMYHSDLSFIEGMKTFPTNTEVRTVKTWSSNTPKTRAGYQAGKVTVGLNYSFVMLPEVPMQRRLFDPRVGYFADRMTQFTDEQQRVESDTYIVRYRLEPKDSADAERMRRGELIEPKKQIVYYIDPATPKQWRKYLIQGVNDWQKAFEAAGWKNAIVGKEWPEEDPTMSMEDARYSVIRYLASDIPNAYGPNVHDPRTGEIIEAHVCWYHNVMKLVHDWYMVQAANIDEAARKMHFDEELMGELIRFVSSHEVGHSIGLRHNFGSSSTVPVDSLRNKAWVEKHGHTPSIMDYARFNYVAQPEDGISREGIFPRINDYDIWAIEWGYRPMFAADPMADHEALETLIKEKHDKNPRLWFGDGETNRTKDSRCQTEDLGDDAIKASEYGIANLKRSLRNLPEWSYSKTDIYAKQLEDVYTQHYTQLVRYMGHVLGNIGGVYADFKTIDQAGAVYSNVSRERQLEVMDFVRRHIATEPTWLIEPSYIKRFNPAPQNITKGFARIMVSRLVNMTFNEEYKEAEYFDDLIDMMFTEARTGAKVTPYRQELQKSIVNHLCLRLTSDTRDLSNKISVYYQAVKKLKNLLRNAGGNAESRAHFEGLRFTIDKTLEHAHVGK